MKSMLKKKSTMLFVQENPHPWASNTGHTDGSKRDDGHGNRIKREVFHSALMTIGDTIVAAQDLDVVDPLKDLVETMVIMICQ